MEGKSWFREWSRCRIPASRSWSREMNKCEEMSRVCFRKLFVRKNLERKREREASKRNEEKIQRERAKEGGKVRKRERKRRERGSNEKKGRGEYWMTLARFKLKKHFVKRRIRRRCEWMEVFRAREKDEYARTAFLFLNSYGTLPGGLDKATYRETVMGMLGGEACNLRLRRRQMGAKRGGMSVRAFFPCVPRGHHNASYSPPPFSGWCREATVAASTKATDDQRLS